MGWKEKWADHFRFSRKDRVAIIVLIVLIAIVFFLPSFISSAGKRKLADADTAWIAAMQRLEQKDRTNDNYRKYDDDNSSSYQYDHPSRSRYNNKPRGELFDFDPNKLSAAEWKRLGLRDKTIGTIQNYLSKGGKFRKPEDLQRIYGLFPDEYERIAPYIKIETSEQATTYNNFSEKKEANSEPRKTFTGRYSVIDINSADTTAFIALPGIGNKLANRIINFRDKLGGFYSIDQVGETFGLPDSTFQKIKQYLKLESTLIRKININTATLEELKAHPYIRWNLANPIIAYREQHGLFSKIEDLKKIMVVTDDIYKRFAPYLITDN